MEVKGLLLKLSFAISFIAEGYVLKIIIQNCTGEKICELWQSEVTCTNILFGWIHEKRLGKPISVFQIRLNHDLYIPPSGYLMNWPLSIQFYLLSPNYNIVVSMGCTPVIVQKPKIIYKL